MYSYFIVNNRVMYPPTTSPYGYSSFPKEENEDSIDFKVSLRGMKIVWLTQRYLAKLKIIINDDEED